MLYHEKVVPFLSSTIPPSESEQVPVAPEELDDELELELELEEEELDELLDEELELEEEELVVVFEQPS